MAELKDIKNFVQLRPLLGTSGQPLRDQFALIADAGYRLVINLALPSSDHAIADEGAVVTGLGMSFAHIPVQFDNPTAADFEQFAGIMDAYAGQPVWVHCVVNARVSGFCYRYLTERLGEPADSSRSPILERWLPQMDATWRRYLSLDADSAS